MERIFRWDSPTTLAGSVEEAQERFIDVATEMRDFMGEVGLQADPATYMFNMQLWHAMNFGYAVLTGADLPGDLDPATYKQRC